MKTLTVFVQFLILIAACAVVGLWPEAAAYGLYHLVQPETELGRIVTVLGLILLGGGLSIFMAILSFALFASGMTAISQVNRRY